MNKDKINQLIDTMIDTLQKLKVQNESSKGEKDSFEIVKVFSALGELFNNAISMFGDIGNFIKFASNYQELEKTPYTFQEMIDWFKENKPKGKFIGAVLKSEEKTEKGEIVYRLDHIFLDAETKDVCMISCPYRVVRTFKLSDELSDHFGSKDLLILE